MADWHTVNTIIGPCKCGEGHLKSIHMIDSKGNFDTVWSLDCPACRSKYDLIESHLEGNPDKSLAVIKYVPKKIQSLFRQTAAAASAQTADAAASAAPRTSKPPSSS